MNSFFEKMKKVFCLNKEPTKETPAPAAQSSESTQHEDPGVNTKPPRTQRIEYDISFVRRGTETPDAPNSWKSDEEDDNPED